MTSLKMTLTYLANYLDHTRYAQEKAKLEGQSFYTRGPILEDFGVDSEGLKLLVENLELKDQALRSCIKALQLALPPMQVDEQGNGPDCTTIFQAIIDASQALTQGKEMNERPEWVRCIRRTHAEHDKESWCGKPTYSFDKPFLAVDHAAENGLQGGRLMACRECVAAAVLALQNGHDDSEYPRVTANEN